ncbi:MAG TPA: Uma2 family endonuclease [Bryobacteraceae bacterium]|nr:Uma2 family endonuclease [Bryobacteraceae bacterium]
MQLLVEHFEQFAGAVLQPASPPLTDAEFLALCAQYPDHRIETTGEGDILILPPAHPRTGQRNAAITYQLFAWTEQDGRGEAFDSSAGFFLKNGARRSPDSAWVSRDRLKGLTDDTAMWHVTPEFVIELKSASDRLEMLRAKMREWTANGVALAWLIIPETRSVEIYRADGSVEAVAGASEIRGEGPVERFVLRLERIWTGIQA